METTLSAVQRNGTTVSIPENEPKIMESEEADKKWAVDSLDRIERHTKPVRKVIVASGLTLPYYSLVPSCCSFTIVPVSIKKGAGHSKIIQCSLRRGRNIPCQPHHHLRNTCQFYNHPAYSDS